MVENNPVADSKGNGQAERAVQTAEGLVRTNFLDVEERWGFRVSVHDAIFPWLVEYATDMCNRNHVGSHGRTP